MFLQSSEVCRIYITISNHVLYRWWHIFCKKIVSKFWWQLELEKIKAKQLSESDWRNYCIVGLHCRLVLSTQRYFKFYKIYYFQGNWSEDLKWMLILMILMILIFLIFLIFLAFYTCKNRTFSFFRISWYKLHMKFTCLRWSGINLNIDLEKTFMLFIIKFFHSFHSFKSLPSW